MLFEKNLFLANKPGKPPFIGVTYPHYAESIGSANYQDLVGILREIVVHLHIKGDRLEIKLIPEGQTDMRVFWDVIFDPDELRKWLTESIFAKSINFGVVIEKNGQYKTALTLAHNKPFYFPVRVIKIID